MLRTAHSIKCKELAVSVGISTGYLSQLEHGIRLNPDPMLLLKIANALNLNTEEATLLFDLYAEETGQLPPDIMAYLSGNKDMHKIIRQARDYNVTEEEWKRFFEWLKR